LAAKAKKEKKRTVYDLTEEVLKHIGELLMNFQRNINKSKKTEI
jgi:hypothetical protein